MNRTQIQLTHDQLKKLRRAARVQGVSVAEMVRRLIDQGIDSAVPDTADRYRRAMSRLGAFRDREGARDVAARHDEFLDEAYR